MRSCVLPAVLLLTVISAAAQPADLAQVVDDAWNAVDSSYYDTAFHGVDWAAVRDRYVEREYADRDAAFGAIRKMLALLDNPATRFLTASQAEALMTDFSGGPQEGVGLLEVLSVDTDEGTGEIVIVTPVPGGPAARAGLRPGDVVVAINGTPAAGLGLAVAAERLRGPAGTAARLTIRRGDTSFNVLVERDYVDAVTPIETSMRDHGGFRVGYVGFRQFTPGAGEQFEEAIMRLEGADGYVLDLRNNPGGFVPVLLQVAAVLLGDAPIAEMQGQAAEPAVLRAVGERRIHQPLVVLVNEGTASAAEVLASALQYHGRAVVVGTPTFGKGLAHGFVPLSDGSAVMPTIGRLHTLDDRDILTAGVQPDVVVPMDESPVISPALEPASNADVQFIHAISLLATPDD